MMNRSNVLEIKDARLAELIEQNQTLQKERAALEQERAAMQACTRMPGHRTPLCTQTRNRADAPVRLELRCAPRCRPTSSKRTTFTSRTSSM